MVCCERSAQPSFASEALIARTALEDAMLHDELPGYADYARRVPWRLIPGVW